MDLEFIPNEIFMPFGSLMQHSHHSIALSPSLKISEHQVLPIIGEDNSHNNKGSHWITKQQWKFSSDNNWWHLSWTLWNSCGLTHHAHFLLAKEVMRSNLPRSLGFRCTCYPLVAFTLGTIYIIWESAWMIFPWKCFFEKCKLMASFIQRSVKNENERESVIFHVFHVEHQCMC